MRPEHAAGERVDDLGQMADVFDQRRLAKSRRTMDDDSPGDRILFRLIEYVTEDLFPFASTVDSGVAELVRKQEAGWAYIK